MTLGVLDLDAIRPCLEGAIPGVMATCALDGTPNVTYVSQVEYVDARHLALSFQFFNKSRRNVLANPVVELIVVHPAHGAMVRITARYLRTEAEGPLFERMKAKLAGIASHTGMSGVFRLRGSDVYAVHAVEMVSEPRHAVAAASTVTANRLSALRRSAQRVAASTDLDSLVERTLDALVDEFGIRHTMLLMLDAAGERLYTVASRGYGRSGAGAEIALGDGVIGVAARMLTPIRINHATLEYGYSRAIRDGLHGLVPGREIPLPGLHDPGSQLAVPLACGGQLLGVLFVESAEEMRFTWDDEDALVALSAQVAALARGYHACADALEDDVPGVASAEAQARVVVAASEATPPLRVRHYEADDSVFLDDDYLIKGVAGAVLWKLLRDHVRDGRSEFTNRELRLAASEIGLPEVGDNLEARLVLLTRRLVDRHAAVRLEKTGRGRFRLCVGRPLELVNVAR